VSALARLCLAGLSAAPAVGPAPDPQAGSPEMVETVFRVPRDATRLALRDVDGDGAADLVFLRPEGVALRFQRADGGFPPEHDAELAWPADRLAWSLVDLDGDGATELVVLEDGRRVRVFGADRADGFDAGPTVLDRVAGFLPRGVVHMDFVRDVDGDGRRDLVVPGSGDYRIYFAREAAWSEPLEVRYEARIEMRTGDPDSLDARFGSDVDISWFGLEDVDGDGRRDLIARTRDTAAFHLADPVLAPEPTWRLDLAALRAEVERTGGIDFDDLFANLDGLVSWRLADLDGEGARDVVVQQGNTFKVYLGGSRSGVDRTPDGLLKSSGNVLGFFLRDTLGDPRPDLQLLRVESLSLGQAIRWLVLPGSLDFDVYTYVNEGGHFSRRPSKRVTLSIRIPRIFSLLEEVEEFQQELEVRRDVPARLIAFDADGLRNDVVDVVAGELRVYRDAAPDDLARDWRDAGLLQLDDILEELLLDELDAYDDGGVKTVDLGDFRELDITPGWDLRQACAGREPAFRRPIVVAAPIPEGGFALSGAELELVEVNGDGRTDLVLIGRVPDELIVQLVVFAAEDGGR